VIAPPEGGESAYRNTETSVGLGIWESNDERGRAFGPTVQFFLPDGSCLSPDAAWVSNEAIAGLTKAQRKKYLPLTPEFVIEVLSLSENLKNAKAKMEVWIKNGVQLAWLIDGDAETVYIYRKGHPMKTRRHLKELAGEGPVEGFVLNLTQIWQGL